MRRDLSLAIVLLLVTACAGRTTSPPPGASPAGGPIAVVATTTVLADLVQQVGGDRVTVRSLVPKGGEAHTFDPAPSDAVAMDGARLLVMNGLGLDDWLLSFAEEAGAGDLPVLKVGENNQEVEYISDDQHPGETGLNPHLWLNAAYAADYVDRIRLQLIEIDGAGQVTYDANAEAYQEELLALHDETRATFEAIPAEQRRVVQFHDAFPYFAEAYGLDVIGVVVEIPGQDPSAAEIAALINAIRDSGARAILAEAQFSAELAQTIASETGVTVVSDLYTDTLGVSPNDTFLGAFEHNVAEISAALR